MFFDLDNAACKLFIAFLKSKKLFYKQLFNPQFLLDIFK